MSTADVATIKLRECRSLLLALNVDDGVCNERGCLVFLSLCGIGPNDDWAGATAELLGITQIISKIKALFGRHYAPNTRETIRDETVHPLEEACVIGKNPGEVLPPNSPKTAYVVLPHVIDAVRSFGSTAWAEALAKYRLQSKVVRRNREAEIQRRGINVRLPDGRRLRLSPEGQNALIEKIIESFLANFAPQADVLFVGDAAGKNTHNDEKGFAAIGIAIQPGMPLPDVIAWEKPRGWLLLIEAVSTQGPIDERRRRLLLESFRTDAAKPLMITAFPDRATYQKFASKVSWKTDVWLASDPEHLIHYDGERFLGPYAD